MINQIKIPTDEEIQRIDDILDQLDVLVAQLPNDYQMDYAQELMGRFVDEEDD